MNVMRWRFHALALCAVGLVACSDRPSATELERPGSEAVSVLSGPVAQLASSDPNAIPIGSPARIEYFGKAEASRHTVVFPLRAPAVDGEQLRQAITTWLGQAKKEHADGRADPSVARVVQSVEGLLAARTPEEIRALLGPARTRIVDSRSLRLTASGLAEHTASYRLDGRELLRVVTNARPATAGPRFNCVDDPTGLEIYPSCPGADTESDADFDPAEIAADMAAMQGDVDGMTSELSSLESQNALAPGDCDAERYAYVSASLGFLWSSGEAVYYAWRRDIPNTYKMVKVAALAYGLAATAHQKYKACLRTSGRPRL